MRQPFDERMVVFFTENSNFKIVFRRYTLNQVKFYENAYINLNFHLKIVEI